MTINAELQNYYNKPSTADGAQIFTRVLSDFMAEKTLEAKQQYLSVVKALTASTPGLPPHEKGYMDYADVAYRFISHTLTELQNDLPENGALVNKYVNIQRAMEQQFLSSGEITRDHAQNNQIQALSRSVTDKTTPALNYIRDLRNTEQIVTARELSPEAAKSHKGDRIAILGNATLVGVGALAFGSPLLAIGAAALGGYGLMLKSELQRQAERAAPSTTFELVKNDLKERESMQGMWDRLMVNLGMRNQEIERQAHLIVGQAQQERDADPHQTIRNFVPVGLSNERQPPAQPSILDVAEIEHGRHERQRGG